MRALVLLLLAAPAAAQDAAPEVILESCPICHAPGVSAPAAIPSLIALTPGELTAKLTAIRDGSQPATILARLARGLTDTEIASLATYVATHGWE